jgi:hypothetical protein
MSAPLSTEAIRSRVTIADTQQHELRVTKSSLDIPTSTVTVVSSRLVPIPTDEDELKFKRLASDWHRATKYASSLSKIAMHPAYQKIIGMGQRALPLIFRDMAESGGHWLWALHAITNEDPAPDNATFRDAQAAWLAWGKAEGYLT